MCMCGEPTINGEPGYSWDGNVTSTRQPCPPPLNDDDTLIYDEPGRCGGIDAHSHHFCLVNGRYGPAILVRHGGGDERIGLGVTAKQFIPSLAAMDSNARYWWMHSLYSQDRDASDRARQIERGLWRQAAAEKRIKTRKVRMGANYNNVKVWIEPAVQVTP